MNKTSLPQSQAAARNRESLQTAQRRLAPNPGLREAKEAILWASSQADPEPLRQMLDDGMPVDIRLGKVAHTPLHVAVGLGHMAVARLLLERGADVMAEDGDGEAVLGYAAEHGSPEMIDLLLLAGANPNQCGHPGSHPLLLALGKGHLAVLDRLLKAGADPEAQYGDSFRPLHLAIFLGRVDLARRLCEAGANPDAPDGSGVFPTLLAFRKSEDFLLELFQDWPLPKATEPQFGHSLLIVAVDRGWRRVTSRLLQMGADPDFVSEGGDTALLMAISAEDEDMVERLLEGGADPGKPGAKDRFPLFVAVAHGNVDIARRLIRAGAPVDISGPEDIPVLAMALRDPDLFLELLEGGADPTVILPSGKNLLFLAAAGHRAIAERLLERGLPVDGPAPDGQTPLVAAAKAGRPELVELLIQRGADVNHQDQEGYSPLLHAVASARGMFFSADVLPPTLEVVDRLLAAGASLKPVLSDGTTLPHLAARCAPRELLQRLQSAGMPLDPKDTELIFEALENLDPAALDELVALGCPLEARAEEGMTPLLYAARFGNEGAVRRLLKAGADVSATTEDGRTILHCAVEGDAPEILTLAIRGGADVNARDERGRTSLALAAELGGLQLVRTLLKAKADRSIQNAEGRTPRQIALAHQDKPMARLLA